MTADNDGLTLRSRDIGGFMAVPTIEFIAALPLLTILVPGLVINSITERADALQAWKVRVASAVKAARGEGPWNLAFAYAITVGISFHLPSHNNPKQLDVENFVKPIIDATAAGLFCGNQTDPATIQSSRRRPGGRVGYEPGAVPMRYWADYDDSGFTTLLIHRLPDAPSREAEGAAIAVSARVRG